MTLRLSALEFLPSVERAGRPAPLLELESARWGRHSHDGQAWCKDARSGNGLGGQALLDPSWAL